MFNFTDHGTSRVYVGEAGRFTCTTGIAYPAWQVNSITVFPQHDGLNTSGIYIPRIDETAASHSSTLTIEGSIGNNNTLIRCVNYTQCCTVGFSYTGFTFRVYGK